MQRVSMKFTGTGASSCQVKKTDTAWVYLKTVQRQYWKQKNSIPGLTAVFSVPEKRISAEIFPPHPFIPRST